MKGVSEWNTTRDLTVLMRTKRNSLSIEMEVSKMKKTVLLLMIGAFLVPGAQVVQGAEIIHDAEQEILQEQFGEK